MCEAGGLTIMSNPSVVGRVNSPVHPKETESELCQNQSQTLTHVIICFFVIIVIIAIVIIILFYIIYHHISSFCWTCI